MGWVEEIRESGRTLRRRRALRGEGCSLRIRFQSFACLVNVSGQGAHCSWGSGTIALCLALMPAFQGSPKIGSGNSWKVITWNSGNSRWFLRAAPKMQPGMLPQLFTFRTLIVFHVYFWQEPWLQYSWALTVCFPATPRWSLCFLGRERHLLPNPLCPTTGFKETGPCNCKLPMKKTKPWAPFLAEASRSAVIVETNESCCWAAGLLVAVKMKRQQLKSALGMSISIRIFV